MSKKMIASLLAIAMLAAMGGCSAAETGSSATESSSSSAEQSNVEESSEAESSAEESSEENAETSAEESSEAAVDSDFAVEIISTSLSKDYEGADVLVVEYNFTNNSDEAASFMFSCEDKAFQNGVECDSSVIGCDEIDSQQEMNDIQPGTTYTLKIGYHLQDATTPVDIQVKSLDFLNEEILLEQSITL